MTSWREIEHIRKAPNEFRALAARILKDAVDTMTEWEAMFLESISGDKAKAVFTIRQAEKLLQIRDDCEYVKEIRGFSVGTLLDRCHLGRCDLSEVDEAWLVELYKTGKTTVRSREAFRLLRCARELALVEEVA
jgi:hypothetical protein